MVKNVIKNICEADVLYDNENLSLPILKKNQNDYKLGFFTYKIEFNFQDNIKKILPQRELILDFNDEILVNEVEFIEEISYVRNLCFPNLLDYSNENKDYDQLVELFDNVIISDFEYNKVKEYAMAFEKYVSENMKQIYLTISLFFFDYINEILKD